MDAARARVLVTGAGGFIGRHVAARLRRLRPEVEVTEVFRRGPAGIGVDLGDAGAVRSLVSGWRGTHVVHACGGHPQLSEPELERVHAGATRNLLDALAGLGRTVRFVTLGSGGQYAAQDPALQPELTESHPDDPRSAYAASKAKQEDLVAAAARQGIVQPTFLRVFNVIGPGQRPPFLVPAILAQLRDPGSSALRLGNLASVRDFVDVRDAADAIVACLCTPETIGERVNVCSGSGTRVDELARRLATAAGRAPAFPILEVPMPPPAIAYQRGSRTKIGTLCGWQPRHGLDDTVREIWRRAHDGSPPDPGD